MPRTRAQLEELERQNLAPYAQFSADSRGRKYQEQPPKWRTEYQRGILESKNGEWSVRITGAQGSGILRSMSEANCFVVLAHEQGAVKAGDYVEVMVMDGLV